MAQSTRARVALSKDFLEAYSKLPRGIQKKTREFTEKFRKDPRQSSLNFEPVEGARDDKVRSLRVDQTYRVIVVQPPRGDVFLCVWVDHHDEAYAWVRNRRFEVNPTSGSFQIYEAVEVEESEAAESEESSEASLDDTPGLLAEVDTEDLLFAGVPSPLLPAVRALRTDEELDDLAPHLPEDAAEMLYLLAAGYGFMEALEEIARKPEKPATVDTENFEAALATPAAQREFKIVEDDADLAHMLEAPLAQWRIFLHPSQRKVVRWDVNGPIRVLGGAGTGKTVALMHRAKYLAREVFTDSDDRLLVTTFTRNLAKGLRRNVDNLCGPEAKRIEVTNLHSWTVGFMRKHQVRYDIASDRECEQQIEQAWSEQVDPEFPLSFYLDEWKQVARAQEVTSRDDYLKARRVGRGTGISRRQRLGVWAVFERYLELLRDLGKVEWSEVIREARLFIEKQKPSLPYRAVLVDEVQDLEPGQLKLLRAIVPPDRNDMFLVGDGHQRIYGSPVALSKCGIEIRGRSKRLKLNYRTTQHIRNYAVALLEGLTIDDLDDGTDDLKGYTSLRAGVQPEVHHFEREGEEAEFIRSRIQSWLESAPPEEICITARTGAQLRDRYAAILEAAGIPHCEITEEPPEDDQGGVRLATMHRMKGLEFPRVLVAGIREGTMPLKRDDLSDDAAREDHEHRERCLFYVAATRARDELVVTGYGKRSPFVRK